MSAWWTGLSAAEASIDCDGQTHTLRWEAGALTALDHDDPEAEMTLAALAGQPAPCLELLGAWQRRRDDPRVLTLGSRGVTDPLDIPVDRRPHPRARTSRVAEAELRQLLALGGGLPDRLQAHAAATWTRRLRTGHSALPTALPQLHAALYGRVLAVLRPWLGEPRLSIELELVDADAPRTLRRTDDVVAVTLPLAWLSEVWARGLATIFGRLCLAAESDDGVHWTLRTVGPELSDATDITVAL